MTASTGLGHTLQSATCAKKRQERADIIRDYHDTGQHPADAARAIGVTVQALEVQMRRHGEHDLARWLRTDWGWQRRGRCVDCGTRIWNSSRSQQCRDCWTASVRRSA